MIRSAALALCALSLTVSANAQEFPESPLRMAVPGPNNDAAAAADLFFANKVEELSGGKAKVDVYFNRQLGKQQEMLPLLEAGAIDFVALETAQIGELPLVGFGNALPMVHFDAERLLKLSRGLYETSVPIKQEEEGIGAKLIFTRHLPHYKLLCREPYDTLSKLNGKKLRSYGAYVPLMWQSIGATGVNIVSTELYDSLSKGALDCAYLPVAALRSFKLFEVARFLIDMEFGMIEFLPVFVSTSVWES